MLTHLRKLEVLSSAEETKIKEAGGRQDQINMFITIVTSKDPQGSDVLLNFIESSDSQVAQLIINHGKRADMGFVLSKHVKVSLTKVLSHKPLPVSCPCPVLC